MESRGNRESIGALAKTADDGSGSAWDRFGGIGTSPLYTVLQLSGNKLDQTVVLGILSLLIGTLILITSVKYITVAMRIDNDGEEYAYATWPIFELSLFTNHPGIT